MNIEKTNKIGLIISSKIHSKIKPNKNSSSSSPMVSVSNITKVFRLTKRLVAHCDYVDVSNIREGWFDSSFMNQSLNWYIMQSSDLEAMYSFHLISDHEFFVVCYEGYKHGDLNTFGSTYNIKDNEFKFDLYQGEKCLTSDNDRQKDLLLKGLKSLAYIVFGDVKTDLIKPQKNIKVGYKKIWNGSDKDVYFVDSLWKRRVVTSGFSVSGHFRLQACGKSLSKRKLIWIESFDKYGYNRLATKELKNI